MPTIDMIQYATAFGVLLLFLIFRNIILDFLFSLLRRITKKTKTDIDDEVLTIIHGPIRAAILIVGISVSLKVAGISIAFVDSVLKSIIIFILFWAIYNTVALFKRVVEKTFVKSNIDLAEEISSLTIKLARFFIVIVGAVAVLEQWDINISTFVASLGIGGLAFALAAKDTVANFFGGIMIFADRSLKIGDWIKGGGVEGIVEEISIRSTKIRTFEHSLITVPNANLANNPIENFSRRGIRRINMRLGLTYSTSAAQIEGVVNDLRDMLHDRDDIDQQTIFIYFDQFADSSLSIFCYFFTATAQWQQYLEIKQDVYLEIMRIVKSHGAEFAFPSQSIYFENDLHMHRDQKQLQS